MQVSMFSVDTVVTINCIAVSVLARSRLPNVVNPQLKKANTQRCRQQLIFLKRRVPTTEACKRHNHSTLTLLTLYVAQRRQSANEIKCNIGQLLESLSQAL